LGSVNFIVDPLYTFKVSNGIDIKQKDFNERAQKTNYLKFINNNFDSLLLGNSRATYINANNLPGKVFNFSVNAMYVSEYDDVIQNFIKITGKTPKEIYIGVDPFSFSVGDSSEIKNAYENTKNIFYPYKNLISLDLFQISLKNIALTYKYNQRVFDRKQRFYDKNMIKGISIENKISNKPYILASKGYKFNVQKNKDLKAFKSLKKKYKGSKFVIFTMPVHNVIYKDLEIQKGYALWLKGLVEVFGKVNHFMYDNMISKSHYTFFDAFHFYPYVGKKIVKNIIRLDTSIDNLDNEFGIILTQNNIDKYLQKLYSKD
jgi:hypothetical protein